MKPREVLAAFAFAGAVMVAGLAGSAQAHASPDTIAPGPMSEPIASCCLRLGSGLGVHRLMARFVRRTTAAFPLEGRRLVTFSHNPLLLHPV